MCVRLGRGPSGTHVRDEVCMRWCACQVKQVKYEDVVEKEELGLVEKDGGSQLRTTTLAVGDVARAVCKQQSLLIVVLATKCSIAGEVAPSGAVGGSEKGAMHKN